MARSDWSMNFDPALLVRAVPLLCVLRGEMVLVLLLVVASLLHFLRGKSQLPLLRPSISLPVYPPEFR